MLVVIESGPGRALVARELARLAERLGYRGGLRLDSGAFRVVSPAGVYYDPDKAATALAVLARVRG